MTETIVINPLTRLEGTGKVKIEVEGGALKDLQFSVAVGPGSSSTFSQTSRLRMPLG